MVGKNNRDLKVSKQGTKVETYGIKKFKVGAASVVIGSSIFFGAGVAAASEQVSNETTADNTTNAKENAEVKEEAPKAVAAPKVEKQTTKEEVAAAVEEKTEAKEVAITVDKTTLEENITRLEAALNAVDSSKAPASTLSAAKVELEKAKALLANKEATADQVAAQAKKLSEQTNVVSTMPKIANETKTEEASKEVKLEEKRATVESEKAKLAEAKTDLETYIPKAKELNAEEKTVAIAEEALEKVVAILENTSVTIEELNEIINKAQKARNSVANAVTRATSGLRDERNGKSLGEEGSSLRSPSDSQEVTQANHTGTSTYTNASALVPRVANQTISGEYNNVAATELTNNRSAWSTPATVPATIQIIEYSNQRDGNTENPANSSNHGGRMDYPLSREQSLALQKEAPMWVGKVNPAGDTLRGGGVIYGSRGSYEFLATEIYGYGYEVGIDEVNIPNFSKRFDLTADAKAAGWQLKGAIPVNLPAGITYNAQTDTIHGRVLNGVENAVYDARVYLFVGNDTQTYQFAIRDLKSGWIGSKDTTPPRIEIDRRYVEATTGEDIGVVNIGFSDNSAITMTPGTNGQHTVKPDVEGGTTYTFADFKNPGSTYSITLRSGVAGDAAIRTYTPVTGIAGEILVGKGAKVNLENVVANGLNYNGTSGQASGSVDEAAIYYIPVMAKDWDNSGATTSTQWNTSGQETHANFVLGIKPKITTENIETYTEVLPVTIAKGSTLATITMPSGRTIKLEADKDENWIVTEDTTQTLVGNNLGKVGNKINVPVTKEDTQKAGVDNITVTASSENVKAALLRTSITLNGANGISYTATLNPQTGQYDLGENARVENGNDVTQRQIYTQVKEDGSVDYVLYEYTRTFTNGEVTAVGAVTRTTTTYASAATAANEQGRAITVEYKKATNTWTASDGSEVTAVLAGNSWDVKTSSGFSGLIFQNIVTSEDKATIINAKPTATSKSYESTLNAKVDLRKAAEAAVTIADKEDDALKASNPTGELASKVTNITRITVTKPSGAQKVYDTVKAAAEYDLAADYTLDEIGVYTVKIEVLDSNTNLVDGTTVGATTSGVDHGAGSSNAETTYTITVKAAIVGNNDNSENIQGAKQTGQPTFTFDNTEKSPINQGTKVYTLETTTATDSTGKAIGLYAIDSNTGVVTFTPNNDYVGTPTPAKVTLTVTFGNDTTGQPITAQATAEYQPVVKPVTPTAVASETTGPQGKAQTSEIKFDAADSDNTTVNFAKGSVEIDATTTKSIPLNKATVTLLDATGNPTTNPVEVFDAAGKKQGTYTLDKATNQITFQPEADFVGTATPVGVQVVDENGTPAKTTYTPTVTPVTLSKEDAKSTAVRGLTQTGKPEFKTSDEKVTIKTVKLIDPTTGNETDNPVVIPNVGTYTMQADGTVKFVPEPGYVTTENNKTLVNVRATDENGKSIDAAYEPTVTPIEVTSTPAQTIDIQGATQNGTPKFELPATVKDVEVKAGTKVAEITGYKLIDPKDNTAKDEVSVDNVGKYTIDPSTGAVKFEPVATYTGKPTPIEVEATVTIKNEDEKLATITAKTTYTPEAVPVKPTAIESATAGKQGQKQTSKIVFDTVDRDATTLHFNKGETSRVLNTDGTAKSVALDKATVTLLDASGNKTTTVTVYEADGTTSQGTYTLVKGANDEYTIEFQPTPEFTGVAKPVDVEILDLNSTPARTIYTPTVIAEDGSVVVEYVEYENGTKKSIEPTETVVNNEKVTTAYTTTPKQISGYKIVRVENPEGTTKDDDNKVSGKVTDGTTTITYVYEKIKQKATLSYFDITTGKEVAIPSAPTENVEGESGKAIDFTNKEATIKDLQKAGYEVVTDTFQAATTSDRLFDNDEAKDQAFKVLVKQRILPVTPTTPNVTPGVPVTPTDPANWSESVKDLQKQLTKEVTRTIKYRYISRTGAVADVDVVQTVKFTREAKVNIVTGAVEFGDWSKAQTLDAVTSPTKEGYTVDRTLVDGATITAESADSEEYVIYTPVKQKATITYKDETGKVLKVDTVEGNSNTTINYTTKTTLDELAKQGFTKVRKDEFTKTGGQTFDNDPKVDQEFEVIVAKVTTSYKDEEGKDIPSYPTKDGELPKENIPGYEFVRTEVDPKGNTTHIYKKVPTPTTDKTTSYEDENGNPLRPTEKGTHTPKEIPGYEFVRTVVDPNGNTTHIYKKVPTPTTDQTTSYVDENGNPLRPTEKGTHTPKEIPGYEFVRTVVDPNGNTTHIYKKVPTPKSDVKPLEDVKIVKEKQLPNTSANNTASNNASAAGLGVMGVLGLLGLRRRKENK